MFGVGSASQSNVASVQIKRMITILSTQSISARVGASAVSLDNLQKVIVAYDVPALLCPRVHVSKARRQVQFFERQQARAMTTGRPCILAICDFLWVPGFLVKITQRVIHRGVSPKQRKTKWSIFGDDRLNAWLGAMQCNALNECNGFRWRHIIGAGRLHNNTIYQ